MDTTAQPWANWAKPVAGREGILYDVTIFLRGSRRRYFDLVRLLENTRALHKHFVHICLGNHADDIRMTIPAVLGEKLIVSPDPTICRDVRRTLD